MPCSEMTSQRKAHFRVDGPLGDFRALLPLATLAGGHGSIAGAILGALIMQSLESGMVLLGVASPVRQIVIGLVLIVAVWIDAAVRRRGSAA